MTLAGLAISHRLVGATLIVIGFVSLSLPATAGEKRDIRTMNDSDVRLNAERNFRRLDKNRDGFIDAKEAPSSKRTRVMKDETTTTTSGPAVWMERRDKNADGRVDYKEFEASFIEMVSMLRTGGAVVSDLPKARKAQRRSASR